jgi:hypothetical protein
MSAKKTVHQLGISIGDQSVELRFGDSVFKLDLDPDGYPFFPESVEKELPPNIPRIVVGTIFDMKKDGRNQAQIDLDILHNYWCEELAGIGMCRCTPVLWDPGEPKLGQCWTDTGTWGALTCVVCHESANGSLGSYGVTYNYDYLFEKLWIDGNDRFYWAFSSKTLICEECLSNIMSETGIRFPNEIDCASSPHKPVLH